MPNIPSRKKLRCAVYTRKSSDEGLEQEFNSLHAQREACEAYILSQREEGWQVLDTTYDDGGFSGGNLERPALQQLLVDVEQKKIDIVVVYKVDRLTRALTDFSRIVERFDAYGVSFVSVTQQFNTTTSMGRLTLNVLLSFAQFEREVTGERIRDKIAASKQKGLWMGGPRPLGYDIHDKKLAINTSEAEIVRQIYQLYLQEGTVFGLRMALSTQDIKTSRSKPFSRGHLYRILNNPLYCGQVRHRNQVYEGQHPPIVDKKTWALVQQRLISNRQERHVQKNAEEPSLLAGLIEDAHGNPLVAHHTNKRGKRYRYYVSRQLLNKPITNESQNKPALRHEPKPEASDWRLPAMVIEQCIIQALIHLFTTPARLIKLCGQLLDDYSQLDLWLGRARQLGEMLPEQIISSQRELVSQIIRKIIVGKDQVELHICGRALYQLVVGMAVENSNQIIDTADNNAEDLVEVLVIPWQIRRRGVEMKLVVAAESQQAARNYDTALIHAVAKGHHWLEQLTSGKAKTLAEIARKNGVQGRWVSKLINLGCLAPDIVERILEGTQPPHLTLQRLIVHEKIPADWQAQRDLFL